MTEIGFTWRFNILPQLDFFRSFFLVKFIARLSRKDLGCFFGLLPLSLQQLLSLLPSTSQYPE
jgi:hypothetical protein